MGRNVPKSVQIVYIQRLTHLLIHLRGSNAKLQNLVMSTNYEGPQ